MKRIYLVNGELVEDIGREHVGCGVGLGGCPIDFEEGEKEKVA